MLNQSNEINIVNSVNSVIYFIIYKSLLPPASVFIRSNTNGLVLLNAN